MSEKKDIEELADIKILVNTFYYKVREDEFLAPVFNNKIQGRWSQHLEKMYTFWQTVLLGEHTYYDSPFPPHANLPVDHVHFQRWLTLFTETVEDLYMGDKADEALWRAKKMAQMFEMKIGNYRNERFKTLV